MMDNKLGEYIQSKYGKRENWFINEVKAFKNQEKVREVEGIRSYLDGNHNILKREPYEYNGKLFHPKKIVMQYAKTLLDFQKQYLLHNPITLTGDEDVVKKLNQVNKKGRYERFNRKVLDKILKYGDVYEYVYKTSKTIKSKLIDADEGFPIYNENNEMLAFIEAYAHDGIEYYNVFTEKTVEKYKYENGKVVGLSRQNNLSGLPIHYHSESEYSDTQGRSELQDWISILDSMEDLLSKYQDSVYKFIDPIFVTQGQILKDEMLPTDIVGKGVNLDDGADARFVGNNLDHQSFESVYKKLMQSLLDISSTPAVSLNKTDVSNLSEVSIKLLFSLANTKASINEQFVEEGIEQRNEKIRELLRYDNVTFDDDAWDTLNMEFTYNTPSNHTEIIENITDLREIGALSMESLLEKSPYTTDIQVELDRLNGETKVSNQNEISTNLENEVDLEKQNENEKVDSI